VLLSSISPSTESFYNCRKCKYTLIRPNEYVKKTKVRILDIKQEKFLKPYLSKTTVEASKKYIQNNKKIMFLINRRGHSTLFQCIECNYIEECPHCKIPLVLHKINVLPSHGSRILKCHYCGYVSGVPERCSRCQGYHIKLLGAGTQKVQEDIESLMGIKTLRIDSDAIRKRADIREVIDSLYRDDVKIIIGTKLLTAKLPPETSTWSTSISMAAILNADHLLNLPDFRATEKAFQEIATIIDKIEPQGEILIQTKIPYHYLYKCIKKNDYNTFFKEELARRNPLNYPPFSRLLLINFISKRDIFEQLSEIVNKTIKTFPPLLKGDKEEAKRGKIDNETKITDYKVEILGPSRAKNRSGENEFKILLKSSVRGTIHSIARKLIEPFKDSRDVKIKVDVDPISI
ncbi:MAG: replication restart helicase PriA, partial [Thermodesulfovibrionales bacterium]